MKYTDHGQNIASQNQLLRHQICHRITASRRVAEVSHPAIHHRVQRMGFVQGDALTEATLVSSAEDALLQAIISNPNHVLSAMMPTIATRNYNFRLRPTATYYLKRTIATI